MSSAEPVYVTPPIEKDLAMHMAKRALPLAPVIILVAGLVRGADGAWSALLAIVIVVVWAVQDEPWIDLKALAVTILGTQLGLLAWECRYVANSLTLPTLQPKETLAP